MKRVAAVLMAASLCACSGAPETSELAPEAATLSLNRVHDCSELDGFDPDGDADLVLRLEIARMLCQLPAPDLDPAVVAAALGERNIAVMAEPSTLTLVARSDAESVVASPDIRASLARIGDSDLWAAQFRAADIDSAILMFIPPGLTGRSFSNDDLVFWRGPAAPDAPVLKPDIAGQVIDREVWSDALQETRRVEVYLPEGHREGGAYPAVFLADGAVVAYYARIVEPLIDAGLIPPIVLVGALSGAGGIVEDRSGSDVDWRNADYLQGFYADEDRFAQHMDFFANELTRYAEREFSVSTDRRDKIVQGHSSGGAFALSAGLMHPEVFATAWPGSPGRGPVREIEPADQGSAAFSFSAGYYDAVFQYSSRVSARTLAENGYQVRETYRPAGHNSGLPTAMVVQGLTDFFAERDRAPQ
ncbi:alpha/beta hydrolase [Maricaulis salignorans]|uniref:alpha/beta hydrolase n=1 Tax=Maricaulis salignorans TaxID=144026 RepID=UPI003A93FF80